MMSKICGHRGAAKYKPENTISGFEWCVKNNINWSECDVQLTDENIALIIHDQTLDRTSNSNGLVQKVKLDELESINVGTMKSKDTFYQKIPTLEELLIFCKKSNLNLNIEMKFYKPVENNYRRNLVKQVLKTIKKTKTENLVLISSFDIVSLKILRESSLEIPLGALFDHLPSDWKQQIENLNISTIHLDFETVTAYQIKEITNKSFKPFVYTCNEPSKIKLLWNAGLEGVITDDPLIFK